MEQTDVVETTVYYRWLFEDDNDVDDTAAGVAAAADSITVELSVLFTQKN